VRAIGVFTKGESVKRFIAVLSLALATLALPVLAAAAGGNGTDGASTGPKVDTSSAIVQLNGPPLATSETTHPAPGKKIDFSSQKTKSYRAQLSALRNDFKEWLKANAPAAKVTGEFDIALNAVAVELNGTSLDTLRTAPQVASADYEGLYYPVADDPDLGIIDAIQAWSQAGGAANAGAGVKVGVVDTGIDATHPCFSDAGYAPQQQFGDRRFTNNKVISAKVFNMRAKNQGFTAEAIQDHGTHVAGTVACNFLTPATVNGVLIPYAMSGVAPKALLGNYNVFPDQVVNARSEDIVDALEAAYEDGFDIANMSLGGGSSGIRDLLAMATDNLDEANMVVAVAAGNSGPGHFTIESPGKAARALTAGASTVPHFVGASLSVGTASYGVAAGDFEVVSANTTAPLGVVLSGTSLSTACAALPANSLSGKIAVIARGTCTFSQKIRNAQDAGAIVAIVVNNVAGDPIAMGLGGIANEPTIPAYMTSRDNRAALMAANGQSATVSAALSYFSTSNVDIMAGFSSQGPTDVDFRVKPDVVAPGVNVLSSVPATACAAPPCFAFFQGTSMATPHLAGSAAVVRGQHPTWSAAQIRSAIVNTAELGVLKNFSTAAAENDVNVIGAGRENLDNAVRAAVALDPVSVSFGAVPSGSGQTMTATVQLSLGAGPFTVSVGPSTGTGVAYSAAVSGSTITVTMSAAKRSSGGDHQATLRVLRGGTEIAHAAVYTLIK
jgi:subtilisin family serine protease